MDLSRIPTALLVIVFVAVSFTRGYILAENGTNEVVPEIPDVIDISSFASNAFIDPDEETTGKLVAEYSLDSKQNPEELGVYLEGDILIPHRPDARNGLTAKSSHWPNGVVPYEITGSFNGYEMAVIEWALNEYHSKTCVRFKPRTAEKDYISFENDKSGCFSSVGRTGGKQSVNLQTPSCILKRGTVLHELMHVLGFIHEQNRYERDNYITVLKQNVKKGMLVNFAKSPKKTADGLGVPYDYRSIMHYSPTSFSKNGQPTIVSKKSVEAAKYMGQRSGFSTSDLLKINAMYKCNKKKAVKKPAKKTVKNKENNATNRVDFVDGGEEYELEMEYV